MILVGIDIGKNQHTFAGVAPYHYESSQFTAQHTAITKKGSRYLRKTLYQIILPVINHNTVFTAVSSSRVNSSDASSPSM